MSKLKNNANLRKVVNKVQRKKSSGNGKNKFLLLAGGLALAGIAAAGVKKLVLGRKTVGVPAKTDEPLGSDEARRTHS